MTDQSTYWHPGQGPPLSPEAARLQQAWRKLEAERDTALAKLERVREWAESVSAYDAEWRGATAILSLLDPQTPDERTR